MDTDKLFLDTPLLRVAYTASGPKDGAPVLLLHGWPDDATTYDTTTSRLAGAGFRTYAPWLRGYGDTRFLSNATMRSGEIAALAQDALDFADALGLKRFSVAGHDWGARVAYFLSAVAPDRVVASVAMSVAFQPGTAPTPAFEQARAYWYQWFMATERGARAVHDKPVDFARIQWDTWSPPGWFTDEDFAKVAVSFENPDFADVTIHSYRVRWQEAEPDPRYAQLTERYKKIESLATPTLVIHGSDDRVALPSGFAKTKSNFSGPIEMRQLDGIGHFPTREASSAVADMVVDFMSRHRS
jgi:pimeloyl-ACP methyl ester carboxylesterase